MISVDLAIVIAVACGLFVSMVVHEFAHAAAALWFGDDTAKRLGRLTLHPLPHIDPVMTIVVPAITLIASGGTLAFGGAKPVPVNPWNLRDPRRDMLWIAAAGPISNVILAVILALAINLCVPIALWDEILAERLLQILLRLVAINLLLTAFNLLPVPPLDGSKILAALLPEQTAESYLRLGEQQGLLLVGLLVLSGATRFIDKPVIYCTYRLIDLVTFL